MAAGKVYRIETDHTHPLDDQLNECTVTVQAIHGGIVIDQGHVESSETAYSKTETIALIQALSSALLEL